MGRGHRASSRAASGSLRNALLVALRGRGWRGARKMTGRSRVAVNRPGPDARRVTIKAHVARMGLGGGKAAALHLRYIQRDGVEKDGSQGRLYTGDGPARAETFEQPRRGEKHQFRLIVSPEDARELELTEFVRRSMAHVEKDLGRRLEWAAVNHYDTDHPHAHVVVRGVDREGREVRLDRQYISNGLRWRAQELATEELGPRLAIDIRRAQAREVTPRSASRRWTGSSSGVLETIACMRDRPRARGGSTNRCWSGDWNPGGHAARGAGGAGVVGAHAGMERGAPGARRTQGHPQADAQGHRG